MKNVTTVFIHGAGSTPVCFNHIRSKLLIDKEILISYKATDGLDHNLKAIKSELFSKLGDEPVNLIGHSLGGLIAVLLYHKKVPINKLVSISAPLGGSEFAVYTKWLFNSDKLIRDLGNRELFDRMRDLPIKVPHLFMVSTNGWNPGFKRPNDGVLSVASQKFLTSVKYKDFAYNHSEILLAPEPIEEMDKFLKG